VRLLIRLRKGESGIYDVLAAEASSGNFDISKRLFVLQDFVAALMGTSATCETQFKKAFPRSCACGFPPEYEQTLLHTPPPAAFSPAPAAFSASWRWL
jgi:hypothetical protein